MEQYAKYLYGQLANENDNVADIVRKRSLAWLCANTVVTMSKDVGLECAFNQETGEPEFLPPEQPIETAAIEAVKARDYDHGKKFGFKGYKQLVGQVANAPDNELWRFVLNGEQVIVEPYEQAVSDPGRRAAIVYRCSAATESDHFEVNDFEINPRPVFYGCDVYAVEPPYAYQRAYLFGQPIMVPNPERAAFVRAIFEVFKDHEGILPSFAQEVIERAALIAPPDCFGDRLSPGDILDVINDPFNAGLIDTGFHDFEGDHESIISEEDFWNFKFNQPCNREYYRRYLTTYAAVVDGKTIPYRKHYDDDADALVTPKGEVVVLKEEPDDDDA